MEIGEKLFKLRKSLNLSQEEMAQGVLSISYLSKVERGIHEITANNLVKMLERHYISVVKFCKEDCSPEISGKL